MYQTKLFGKTLITDNPTLYEILTSEVLEGISDRIDHEFPTLKKSTVECLHEVEAHGVPASIVIYLNHRVQAWAGCQLDVEPSTVRFVPQAGKYYES